MAGMHAEKGGNFIDTAEAYPVPMNPDWAGDSEVIIGKWMKERGCRNDVIIATKVRLSPELTLTSTRDASCYTPC